MTEPAIVVLVAAMTGALEDGSAPKLVLQAWYAYDDEPGDGIYSTEIEGAKCWRMDTRDEALRARMRDAIIAHVPPSAKLTWLSGGYCLATAELTSFEVRAAQREYRKAVETLKRLRETMSAKLAGEFRQ